eukprot:226709-Chlamydomonas_euryale.AAC.2
MHWRMLGTLFSGTKGTDDKRTARPPVAKKVQKVQKVLMTSVPRVHLWPKRLLRDRLSMPCYHVACAARVASQAKTNSVPTCPGQGLRAAPGVRTAHQQRRPRRLRVASPLPGGVDAGRPPSSPSPPSPPS